MMDQRKTEGQLRCPSLRERPPLQSSPAECRGRVDEVGDEREDRRAALVAKLAEEHLDDRGVAVEGDHAACRLGRDPGVATVVAAQVPHQVPAPGARDLAHELRLALRLSLAVARRRRVLGPRRGGRVPAQPAHESLEAADVRQDQFLLEAGRAELALQIAAGVRVSALEPAVQRDMGRDATPEEVTAREEPPALAGRDAFDSPTEPRLERHALVGLEEERVEEEHAELPVAEPRLSRAEPFEGADVDEHGLRAAPLNVVRSRVLQHQIVLQRSANELELEQCRLAQHPEAPLVRVGDERDDFVLEDGGGGQDAGRLGVLVEPSAADALVRLADAEEAEQAPPVHLADHCYCGGPTCDRLEDHAPGAGVEVAELRAEHDLPGYDFRRRVANLERASPSLSRPAWLLIELPWPGGRAPPPGTRIAPALQVGRSRRARGRTGRRA